MFIFFKILVFEYVPVLLDTATLKQMGIEVNMQKHKQTSRGTTIEISWGCDGAILQPRRTLITPVCQEIVAGLE